MLDRVVNNFKEFFGETNEVVESTRKATEDRMTSPFYGYFLISWFILNWYYVYVALFLDQEKLFEKTGLLRSEYILFLMSEVSEKNLFLRFFIYPFLITVLFFWIFPYITRVFYRKNIRNQKALRIIELQESRKEMQEERELVKEKKSLIQEEVKKIKVEKKAEKETPEVVWEAEFNAFRRSLLFKKFDQILDSVYRHDGKVRANIEGTYRISGYDFEVDKDILIYADTNGLISLSSGSIVSFTDKGRYFAQRYSQIRGGVVPI